jgi:hypothetical protein
MNHLAAGARNCPRSEAEPIRSGDVLSHLLTSRPAQLLRVHSPFPLSVTEFGLPGSGLSATLSVPLYDFLAAGVNVTA